MAAAGNMIMTTKGEIDAGELAGSWRVISAQAVMSDTGEAIDYYGPSPTGFGMFDSQGRWMIVMTASGLSEPKTDAEYAALFKCTGAYTGRFVISGNRMVTKVDAAIMPSWMGTEQPRFLMLEGNRLTISTAEQEVHQFPGRKMVATLVFEREF
jgi:hypothetical protein